jgi:hypothetical protein
MSILDQTVFAIVAIYSYLAPPILLLWAWITFGKGFAQPRWRAWLGAACLSAVSLQWFGYIIAFLRLGAIPEFGDKINFWLDWSRINFRISAMIIVVVGMVSKGRYRIASVLTSIALILNSVVVDSMK